MDRLAKTRARIVTANMPKRIKDLELAFSATLPRLASIEHETDPESVNREFSRLARAIRRKHHIRPSSVADSMGINIKHLTALELGRERWSFDEAMRYITALHEQELC